MEGEEYVALNPDSFHEDDYWTYRDLQKLCMKLSLGGRGTREELITKLTHWHREREFETQFSNENYPMNVVGNNFSLLQIKIQELNSNSIKRRRRRSSISSSSVLYDTASADPILLRPIRKVPADSENIPPTPTKGILKKTQPSPAPARSPLPLGLLNENENDENQENLSSMNCQHNSSILNTPTKPIKLTRLHFSPFNGIKIISHRYSQHSVSSYHCDL
jgi:hypothetical protein